MNSGSGSRSGGSGHDAPGGAGGTALRPLAVRRTGWPDRQLALVLLHDAAVDALAHLGVAVDRQRNWDTTADADVIGPDTAVHRRRHGQGGS